MNTQDPNPDNPGKQEQELEQEELEFVPLVDERTLKREKEKARTLRASPWWKRKRSRGICHYCGQKFKPADLTMDHLIPIIRGGQSIKANLVPACKECNNQKKYLLPTEWVKYLNTLKEKSANPGSE